MLRLLLTFALILPLSFGASFVNGNFETGDATGWTLGGGYRGNDLNPALTADRLLPGGNLYNAGIATTHSGIVSGGTDPRSGGLLNRVYSGNYSWRVEDTTTGGYASAISQTVVNYTDPDIFFAWAAVLQGAHGVNDAATVKIFLKDLTIGDNLITREYNAASGGGGVDQRFTLTSGWYWTQWQIEQLTLPQDRIGHDFLLSVLASDCEPTGHAGYLYLDGFGAVAPPPQDGAIPEPATILLTGGALLALGLLRRRRAGI